MNAQSTLTDATLEAMLARRAGDALPVDLAEAIGAAVAQTPQARRPLWMLLWPSARRTHPVLRLAWIIALIGLLLAVAVSVVLVGSELFRRTGYLTVVPPSVVVPDTLVRHPAPLEPSGVVGATGRRMFSLASTSALAVGPDGVAWALGSGRLLRIDADGAVRDWTLVDDPAFGRAQGLAPSRFGGVWMFDSTALRRFDGSTFADVVEIPTPASGTTYVADAFEGPDGQLWVTLEQAVRRWDGSSWTDIPWTFDASPGEIGFDARGRLWVGLYEYPGPYGLGVAVYDETAWTEYAPDNVPIHGQGSYDDPNGGAVVSNVTRSIASAPDGSMWFGTDGGLVRFDGTTWMEEQPFGAGSTPVSSVSIGSDGTVWAVVSGCQGCTPPRIARLDGGGWQLLDPPSGIEDYGGWALVAATGDGVTLAADAGTYRLSGERWSRIWPAAPPTGPGWVSALAAVSADEVLAGSGSYDGGPAAVWRYRGGAWQRDTSVGAPDESIRSLVFGPGGSLWAGGEGGLQVRREGTWTSLIDASAGGPVWQVVPAADGTVWVAAGEEGLIAIRPDGPTWRREEIGGSPLKNVQSVAVTSDGTIWAGSNGGWFGIAGLARFDGQAWHLEYPLGGPPPEGGSVRITVLLAASDGSLWVAGEEWASASATEAAPRFFVARLREGAWTVHDVGWPMSALAEHPDGTILGVGDGIWTFDDGRWTQELKGVYLDQLSVAPDGAVWVAGPDVYRVR